MPCGFFVSVVRVVKVVIEVKVKCKRSAYEKNQQSNWKKPPHGGGLEGLLHQSTKRLIRTYSPKGYTSVTVGHYPRIKVQSMRAPEVVLYLSK